VKKIKIKIKIFFSKKSVKKKKQLKNIIKINIKNK
jgi:hypothetical protein